jgi:hypothetical protein
MRGSIIHRGIDKSHHFSDYQFTRACRCGFVSCSKFALIHTDLFGVFEKSLIVIKTYSVSSFARFINGWFVSSSGGNVNDKGIQEP